MGHVSVSVPCQMASVDAVITRCGCPGRGIGEGPHPGVVCPNPASVTDLGTVAYWHRNPLRVLAWMLGRALRRATKFARGNE
jgi:hypothetical protein